MSSETNFEQTPPLDVPLRFFVTSAFFGIAAGLLFIFAGDGLVTRQSSVSLALTHLMTVGFMLQVMTGALLQLMPVAAGVVMWRPRVIATWVHILASLGGIALVIAFLDGRSTFYVAAGSLLALATLPFGSLLLTPLVRTSATGDMLNAMRAAGVALMLTVCFGLILAASRAGLLPVDWLVWMSLHIRLGWLGWGLLLLTGVSYQVVPMFQLTPPYPALFRKCFLPGVLVLLVIGAFAVKWPVLEPFVAVLESMAVMLFAGVTLDVQRRRRRNRSDTSFYFWRVALVAMLLAALLRLGGVIFVLPPMAEVSLGILVLVGGFASVMIGMLYKIVPFLVWLHLQRQGIKPLLMHEVISAKASRRHLWVHILALLLCVVTPWWTSLSPLAGSVLALGFSVLLFNVTRALIRFRLSIGNSRVPDSEACSIQSS